MNQTDALDIVEVTEKVDELLTLRQDRGIKIDEFAFERMLHNVVQNEEEADRIYDQVRAQPAIRYKLEVAAMVFNINEPVVNCGGKYFEESGGTQAYMRDVL